MSSVSPLFAHLDKLLQLARENSATEVRLSGGHAEMIGYESLPVGVVTLAERWGDAAFTERGFEAMVSDVEARLEPFDRVHRIADEIGNGGVTLLGTSGTVTTLAGIVLNLERYRRPAVDGVSLSADDAADALERRVFFDRLAERFAVAQMGRPGERLNLRAGIVHIIFAGNGIAGIFEQGGERLAGLALSQPLRPGEVAVVVVDDLPGPPHQLRRRLLAGVGLGALVVLAWVWQRRRSTGAPP